MTYKLSLYWHLLTLAWPLVRAIWSADPDRIDPVVADIDHTHRKLGHR